MEKLRRLELIILNPTQSTPKTSGREEHDHTPGWLKRKLSGRDLTVSPGKRDSRDKDGSERLQYDNSVEAFRKEQYPMLTGVTYLDHAGTTQPSRALIKGFTHEIQTKLMANPHSALASSPSVAQTVVASSRLSVLKMFNASPEHFEVVFVANATAAIKLVAEAFHGHLEGFDYYYHRDCHTSLVGVRELAHRSHCFASDDETERWLDPDMDTNQISTTTRPALFAYPAQSNMNGRRLPLTWPQRLRSSTGPQDRYVLLDVAAFVSTSPLDLSDHTTAPDFMSLSFYKIFGFPDLGALIVRKSAAHVFGNRRYFGGGTTDMITVEGILWVARKKRSLSDSIEDGTSPIRSILALKCAIEVHKDMYGGLAQVSRHTTWLAKHLYDRLIALKYANGQPVCHIYKDPKSVYGDSKVQGATVAFNIMHPDGSWFESSAVGNLAMAANIHLRSGALCNPGGMAHALNMTPEDIRKDYAAGRVCGQGIDGTTPYGMVRASFGACSTLNDVLVLVQFVKNMFISREESPSEEFLQSISAPGSWRHGSWGMFQKKVLSRGRRKL